MAPVDRLGPAIGAVESVARAGVLVLLGFIAARILAQDSDGGVAPILVVPVIGYAAWNLGFVVWLWRRVAQTLDADVFRGTARVVGALAAVRLVWLIPLALDPSWRSPALVALIAVSCATLVACVRPGLPALVR